MRSNPPHPKYRPDIDGLRAVAVLSVIGFHLFPSVLRGGFIGVDIFFVISGFLISSIIFEGLERGSFSFIDFYTRRIKRIFPALLLVLIASFAIGWFMLLADEYKQLGKHIAAGAGFVSNFALWGESDYFDTAAETKPLLHLWSLGIEEQFYFLWPLLLWAAWIRKFNLLKIVIAIAVISFVLNVRMTHKDAASAFYLPHARFWELLAGAVLAYVTLYKNKALEILPHHTRSLLGGVFIVVSLFIIYKGRSFPGYWALLPVAGAVLLISAGTSAWFNKTILSNRLLVWFGLISYPLYLWHWPLWSFLRIAQGETPTYEMRLAIFVASVGLAWLTYRFVETPIRTGDNATRKRNILIVLMIMAGGIGYGCYTQSGFPQRSLPKLLDPYTQTLTLSEKKDACFEIPFAYETSGTWFCTLGAKDTKPTMFAYGDSHALGLIPALDKFGVEQHRSIPFIGNSGCPPLLGIQSVRGEELTKKYNCQKINERIFEYVKNNDIKSVLLIARWSYYTGGTTTPNELNPVFAEGKKYSSQEAFAYGIKQTIDRYKAIGVKVYIMGDNPQQIHNPMDALRKYRRQASDSLINQLSVPKTEHLNNQRLALKIIKNNTQGKATYINFDNLLCPNDTCPLVVNSKFLYKDSDHLSIDGSLYIYPTLRNALLRK